MRKILIILYIIFICFYFISCGKKENKENNINNNSNNSEKTAENLNRYINNINNDVEIINLSSQNNNINRCLFYQDETKTILIKGNWDVYHFDIENYKVKEKLGNINIIDKKKLIPNAEKPFTFTYFDKSSIIELKTHNENTGKISTYLINYKTNQEIDFNFIKNNLSDKNSMVTLEIIACLDNGNDVILLGYENDETYSSIYLADIGKKAFTTLLDNSTILSYNLSKDRKALVFFGNTEERLPVELYDFSIRGNFFMYSREENPAWLYILDLNNTEFNKVPQSSSYFYGSLYKDSLRVEDSYGEFITVNPSTGEKISDINNALYKVMEYYKDAYSIRETDNYTLMTQTDDSSGKVNLVYFDKKTDEEINLLSVDNASIQNVIALNNDYAVFSLLENKSGSLNVCLINLVFL